MKKEHKNLNPDNLIKSEAYSKFIDKEKEEILKGLQAGLDVSIYAKKEYSWDQMREIRLGLKSGVDVSTYANPEYNSKKMQKKRLRLENKIDISAFVVSNYKEKTMKLIKKNVDK